MMRTIPLLSVLLLNSPLLAQAPLPPAQGPAPYPGYRTDFDFPRVGPRPDFAIRRGINPYIYNFYKWGTYDNVETRDLARDFSTYGTSNFDYYRYYNAYDWDDYYPDYERPIVPLFPRYDKTGEKNLADW